VEEAAGLLGNARTSLEEKDYLEAGEYVRSSRYLLEISAKTYFALRSAVEKAETERKKLEESGLDTTELSSKLSDLRSAIVRGEYQEAKTLLDEERRAAADLRLPYFQRPASASEIKDGRPREKPKRAASKERPVPEKKPSLEERPAHGEMPVPEKIPPPREMPAPEEKPSPRPEPEARAPAVEPPAAPPPSPSQKAVPKFSSGISACPNCGRKTMKGWKKCPHCLASLT
jgi:outer membrane biosynthesis protein TonB